MNHLQTTYPLPTQTKKVGWNPGHCSTPDRIHLKNTQSYISIYSTWTYIMTYDLIKIQVTKI